MQYSFFSVISRFPCTVFRIFLQFSLPPPFTKLKLGKNSGYTRPTLFVGWGEGFDLCELVNTPEMQKCPKTFVDDWRWKALNRAETNGGIAPEYETFLKGYHKWRRGRRW